MTSRHPDWTPDSGQQVLDALPADERLVLPALQAIQRAFGYVPDSAVAMVAEFVNVSVAEVHGVLTFYHDLRRTPPAPVTVALCTAEACQANGSRGVVNDVTARLAKLGGRTEDGSVEVVEVFCLGNCALGPAALVNERLLGRIDGDVISDAVTAARAEVGA